MSEIIGACPRCKGTGYRKLPPGHYGMLPCTLCYGSGKDPIKQAAELGKKITEHEESNHAKP